MYVTTKLRRRTGPDFKGIKILACRHSAISRSFFFQPAHYNPVTSHALFLWSRISNVWILHDTHVWPDDTMLFLLSSWLGLAKRPMTSWFDPTESTDVSICLFLGVISAVHVALGQMEHLGSSLRYGQRASEAESEHPQWLMIPHHVAGILTCRHNDISFLSPLLRRLYNTDRWSSFSPYVFFFCFHLITVSNSRYWMRRLVTSPLAFPRYISGWADGYVVSLPICLFKLFIPR